MGEREKQNLHKVVRTVTGELKSATLDLKANPSQAKAGPWGYEVGPPSIPAMVGTLTAHCHPAQTLTPAGYIYIYVCVPGEGCERECTMQRRGGGSGWVD